MAIVLVWNKQLQTAKSCQPLLLSSAATSLLIHPSHVFAFFFRERTSVSLHQ